MKKTGGFMVMGRDEIVRKLKQVIGRYRDTIVFAYLFGSFGENSAGPLSDIDIAIYVDNSALFGFNEKLRFHADCCRALQRDDIDVVVLNQLDNLILSHEVIEEKVILYDSDPEKRFDYETKILHRVLDFRIQRARIMGP
jgi:predicted nucleotidyltransferase